MTAEPELEDGFVSAAALLELLVGVVLVACSLGRKQMTALALTVANAVWLGAMVLPFGFAPAQAILQFASPRGVVVALAQVAVLIACFEASWLRKPWLGYSWAEPAICKGDATAAPADSEW